VGRYAVLLDRIGPPIVLRRSQLVCIHFTTPTCRPGKVKAMIDIEGAAPAFKTDTFSANCYTCQTYNGVPSTLTPLWGVTNAPITYSPEITAPVSQLVCVPDIAPAGPNLGTWWLRGRRCIKLPNLNGIPIMIMVAQSSFAAQTEICMHRFLLQAGVKNDLVHL